MMKHHFLLVFVALLMVVSACNKGEKLPNVPPATSISLTSINLTGDDRLRSEVTLHWFGTDEDGWVTGYEISLDGSNWVDVGESQDSTFNFQLTFGSDTTDINFYVRAIDNEGDVDATPAYLLVPIRNSAPTAVFDSVQGMKDTTFIVTTLFLNVADLDGQDNIDSIFIKFNNGAWFALSPTVNTVTIVPTDPTALGVVDAKVYKGPEASLVSGTLTGLNLEGDNTIYLKARDIAQSESVVDTSELVFVKRKANDLLLIDAHPGGSVPSPESVYAQALANVEGYDHIDLRVGGGVNIPNLWSPTFSKFIDFYPRIFWYGDASILGLSLLEDASGAIQAYLNEGGKILISTGFPSSFTNESVLMEYTPLDSISTVSKWRLPTDSLLDPMGAFAATFDTLEASVFVSTATPMYVKSNAAAMYDGHLFLTSGPTGPTTLIARAVNDAGKTNVVLATVELHKVFGRPTAFENFLNQVLLHEFNW